MLTVKTLTKTFELNRPREDASPLVREVWDCIPSYIGERMFDREDEMGEIAAILRGEHGDIDIVARCLGGMKSWPLVIYNKLAPHWTPQSITLVCSDGELSYCSLPSLRRRFQLIDDYFADHPDEKSIGLNCTKKEMGICMMEAYFCCLSETHKALSYLNPKNNMYALHCDLGGTPLHILQQFTSRLTAEERAALVSYAEKNQYRVPSAEGVFILGALPSVRGRREAMKTIYRERYPSFLFSTLSSLDVFEGKQEILDLLLCGFEADRDEMPERSTDAITYLESTNVTLMRITADEIREQVRVAVGELIHCMELDVEMRITLARMSGLVIPGRDEAIPTLPYGVTPQATPEQQGKLADLVLSKRGVIYYDVREHPSYPSLLSISQPS